MLITLSGPLRVYSWLVHLEFEECTAESSEQEFSGRTVGRGEISALLLFPKIFYFIFYAKKNESKHFQATQLP